MKINIKHPDPALINIMRDPEQIITLDANFLIPPDRKAITERSIRFDQFRKIWLDPIFSSFPKLAIHEAVLEELVEGSIRRYVDTKRNSDPTELIIHADSSLNELEMVLRDAVETRIAPLTRYDRFLDNKEDRGEVKSLSFIAVKNLPYFAAHDYNALLLIEEAEKFSTGLDNVQAIKMFELIYWLLRNGKGDKNAMRMLYKYQYFLTPAEKKSNPEWSVFITAMDSFYKSFF